MVEAPGASKQALLRLLIISQVRLQQHLGGDLAAAVKAVSARDHVDLDGHLQRRSARTLYRWLKDYEAHGLAGLEPASRCRTNSSVVLPERLLAFIAAQKKADQRASIPELIRRARELGIVQSDLLVDRTTLWRACRRLDITVARRKGAPTRDSRRFEYPHRMDMVLADGKHFRAGVARARRVALFFLDDTSRVGLHVVVGTSENKRLFLRGLYEMIRRFGLFGILYLDHGPGFIALDTIEVVAKLPALLIYGEAAYPEGHGKIERFNRTAKAQVLRFDRRPDIDPDCGALELRLQHYLRDVYNHSPHESLGGLSPWQRFSTDPRHLRFPENDRDLKSRFVLHLERPVSNDHVVTVDSIGYEMPRGHAGRRVTLHRQVLDNTLWVLHLERLVQLHPVDLAANARTRRAKSAKLDDVAHPLPKSAADLAFERDFAPVVDADGGFSDPETEKE